MNAAEQERLERAIARVASGDEHVLHLSGFQGPFELPPSASRLRGLRVLSVRRCPRFRWPSDVSGWPSFERVRLRDDQPVPSGLPWTGRIEWDIPWATFMSHPGVIDAGMVRGLYIDRLDRELKARWCFTQLEELELVRLERTVANDILDLVASRSPWQMRALRIARLGHWHPAILEMAELEALIVLFGPRRHDVELSRLTSLRSFALVDSGVEALPREPEYWSPRLEWLDLSRNMLSRLPPCLGWLERLQTLLVGRNRLTELTDELSGHPALRVLDARQNPLDGIPDWLLELPALQSLKVEAPPGERRAWTLGASVLGASRLTGLSVEPRDFATPPPEVMAQGLPAIKAYWRQRGADSETFLSETKLLIVGAPGAGKTTLARRLTNPEASMPRDDESTRGIDVRRWDIDGHVRIADKTVSQRIDVNIWDFGGQEIYSGTHQFFLSRRSVYILVTDGRREDTAFYYWLRTIDFFGRGCPVLIVLNARHGRTWEVDIEHWRRRFPSLVGAVTADLSKPDDVRRVRREVERHILGLEHLSTPFPIGWRQVRDLLDARRQAGTRHITLDDYSALCAAHGFDEPDVGLILSRFLHDIGACLHFQDVPALLKTIVLDPEWGTDAVYRVLDHGPIVEARGLFTDAMLADVWSEPRYAYMHAELLALMQRFGLCYPLPGGRGYIAPQLLSPIRPDYRLPSGNAIALRYRYGFMPRDIVTRFIAAAHALVADERHVWRTGVVLKYRDAHCEVIEDHPGRELVVRAVGPDARELAAIVDVELRRIHDGFSPALDYDTWVPCYCVECQGSDAPMLFAYTTVLRYSQNSELMKCDRSFATISPTVLLDGALSPRAMDTDGFDRPAAREDSPGGVFVSYAWRHAPTVELVDRLQARCDEEGIHLQRDAREVRYKESFQRFMDALGAGDCVVVVLSGAYFESRCCMYELLALAEHPDFIDRVYPIVAEAGVFDDERALDAEIHWQAEYARFESKLKRLDQLRARKHDEGLRVRAAIVEKVGELHRVLADLNALPDVVHGDALFDGIMAAIKDRLRSASSR